MDADMGFHQALAHAAGSPRLERLYESLSGEIRLCIAQLRPSWASPAAMGEEHRDLLAVIAEELGFAGVAVVIALFTWLLLRGARDVHRCRSGRAHAACEPPCSGRAASSRNRAMSARIALPRCDSAFLRASGSSAPVRPVSGSSNHGS